MLDATEPPRSRSGVGSAAASEALAPPTGTGTVALFRGCVMDGLFDHVHQATRRTLEANGYRVVEVAGQACCGALHEHAGDRSRATQLARANLDVFRGRADYLAVNSAGCGAFLKEATHSSAADNGSAGPRIMDVSELLAAAGPRPGAPLTVSVGYDPPCHLQHGQGVHQQALQLLGAIPNLDLRVLPGAERCCGSAGIYGVLHPELSRTVLDAKIAAVSDAAPRPTLLTTGNPGCLMQIGAGLKAAGLDIRVAHPVELLDWSYRAAGFY
jgi:glycolate oxidase iron-sulfur subunit